MGFFSGLLMFQAVIVLWIFTLAFGFIIGVGIVFVSVEKVYPDVYKKLNDTIEQKKGQVEHDRSDDSE